MRRKVGIGVGWWCLVLEEKKRGFMNHSARKVGGVSERGTKRKIQIHTRLAGGLNVPTPNQ